MEGLEALKVDLPKKKEAPDWWPGTESSFTGLKPYTLYRDREGRWRGPDGKGGLWATDSGRFYTREERRSLQRALNKRRKIKW